MEAKISARSRRGFITILIIAGIAAITYYSNLVGKAREFINAQLGLRLHKKPAKLVNTKPMITFTFDDFPASACRAADLLKAKGYKGTFYTCLQLMGTADTKYTFYDLSCFKKLLSDGHEIASHTYAHISCKKTEVDQLNNDLDKNQHELNRIFPGYTMNNFAYPFGEYNAGSKQLVDKKFSSSRSTLPGINTGVVDLNLLKANKLYNRVPVQNALDLISENSRKNGWLIFYTHDVKENASMYGCSEEYFLQVLDAALRSGSEILTIQQALQKVRML